MDGKSSPDNPRRFQIILSDIASHVRVENLRPNELDNLCDEIDRFTKPLITTIRRSDLISNNDGLWYETVGKEKNDSILDDFTFVYINFRNPYGRNEPPIIRINSGKKEAGLPRKP